jgi:hypothetical protein
MIRLFFALGAEVILALRAANSILAHVLGGHFVDLLTLVILDVVVDLSFYELNEVPALALYQVLLAF